MDNQQKPSEKQMDELLAEYADQQMSSHTSNDSAHFSEDVELAQLQKTVLRMRNAALAARPAPAKTAHNRKEILMHWASARNQSKQATTGKFTWSWQKTGLALGALALTISIIILPYAGNDAQLAGSASGTNILFPIISIIGIIGLVILFWIMRNR